MLDGALAVRISTICHNDRKGQKITRKAQKPDEQDRAPAQVIPLGFPLPRQRSQPWGGGARGGNTLPPGPAWHPAFRRAQRVLGWGPGAEEVLCAVLQSVRACPWRRHLTDTFSVR